jgi:membrane protein required for colicin V production
MNYIDIIILCITGLLIFNGIRKGFIISLASLVALVLGIWGAVHFSGFMSGWLVKTFHPSGTWLTVLSFTLTFLLVVIVVMIIAKLLEKVVKTVGLGLINRIAGGLFGLLKGVLIVSVLLFILVCFDPDGKLITPKAKKSSVFYGYIEKAFPVFLKITGEKGIDIRQ